MRRRRLSVAVLSTALILGGACSDSNGGGGSGETVSAEEYARGVCSAIGTWIDDVMALQQDLQENLDPTSLDSLKDAMVGFMEDMVSSTDTVISDVEAVGTPDVDNGEAAAEAVLTALRGVRTVFQDAGDRVADLGTDDPQAFASELQSMATDVQSSVSDIGSEFDQFESPELKEVFEDVPECDEVAAA